MISNDVCNGVTSVFVTLPPTQPDPAQPSPAQPLSFGHLPSIRSVGNARATTAPSGSIQPLAPAPAWMASPLNDTATGLATIEGINLDADIPCAGRGCHEHDHPADFIVEFTWPHGCHYRGARCLVWWVSPDPLNCMLCRGSDWRGESDGVAWIVEHLR